MAEVKDRKVDTKWYVSGPMRGLPDMNFPRFRAVTAFLRAKEGQAVWSPHEALDGAQDATLNEYFAEDFPALLEAHSIVFLPGWQNSAGARIEYLIAKELGLKMHLAIFVQPTNSDEYVHDIVGMLDRDVPAELEAGAIVRNGERQATYGHPNQDFYRTAALWKGLSIAKSVDPADMALAMVCLKLSRLKGTRGHQDSIVDAIGYLICYQRIVSGQ